MQPRSRLLLFLLPWLIILLVPSLRLAARVQIYGSEYTADCDGQVLVAWARFLWAGVMHEESTTKVLSPTTHELAAPNALDNLPIEIMLKAPESQDEVAISIGKAQVLLDEELKKRPGEPWLLAMRLRTALVQLLPETRGTFAPPPFHWSRADSGEHLRGAIFPLAGRVEQVLDADPTFPGSPSQRRAPLVLRAMQKSALNIARRGRISEPDNAYWPWQIAYLLFLNRHEAEAAREIVTASHLRRFDEHHREEIRAALLTARAHRMLTWDESLAVAQRQNIKDPAWPQREFAFLWLARRYEKRGDLSLTAAITRVAARMQEGAVSVRNKRQAVLLQSAAWMGRTRSVYWAPAKWAPSKQFVTPEFLPAAVGFSNIAPLYHGLTPFHFATRFAGEARRRGQPVLANEALRLGQQTTIEPSLNWGYQEDKERFGIKPWPIVQTMGFAGASELVLWQLQFTLVAWLLLCFMLWPRLSKPGSPLERTWRIFAVLSRLLAVLSRSLEASKLNAEPVILRPTSRDVRSAMWLSGLLVLFAATNAPFGFKAIDWFHDIGDWYYSPQHQIFTYIAGGFFIFGPVVACAFYCICGAIWRYKNLNDARPFCPELAHVPPSVKPLVAAFMAWSIMAGAVLTWLAWLIPMKFGLNSLSYALPSMWSGLLGQSALDFALPPEAYWMPILTSLMACGVWLLKWVWQMPLCYRGSAFGFSLHWQRAALGTWLIIASWLYLIFLGGASVPSHILEAQLTAMLAALPMR